MTPRVLTTTMGTGCSTRTMRVRRRRRFPNTMQTGTVAWTTGMTTAFPTWSMRVRTKGRYRNLTATEMDALTTATQDGVADDNDLCPEEAWEYVDSNGDGCDDVSQWFLMITPIDTCYPHPRTEPSCSMWIRSIG